MSEQISSSWNFTAEFLKSLLLPQLPHVHQASATRTIPKETHYHNWIIFNYWFQNEKKKKQQNKTQTQLSIYV